MEGKIKDIEIINLIVPEFPAEKSELETTFEKFQRFGSDNLFPQQIALINRQGTTHRAILNNKTLYCVGQGFITDENNLPLIDFIKKVNNKNESLKKLIKKVIFDYLSFGNGFIELVTNQKKDFLNIFHQQTTRCRISLDGKNVLIHPDWNRYYEGAAKIKTVPLYPIFEKGKEDEFIHSIVHIKNYEPEFTYYGVPSWLAAMDAAAIGYKTNKWNVSRLDNQFTISALLELTGSADDENLKKGKAAIKKEFTNEDGEEGKNSKLIVITKEPGADNSAKYTPFVQNSEGEWINLHKQSDQDCIIAHNWFRSLSGLAEAGQLGNTQQIRSEYEIAKNTVIAEIQELMLDEIKMILQNETKIKCDDLTFKNVSPVGISDLLDINSIIKKGEGRKMLGLIVDKNDATMEDFIKKDGNNFKILTQ